MLPRTCLDCGEGYGESLFLWLSDELWKSIGCEPHDFLCAHCTIDRLEKSRSYVYLVAGVGEHTINAANAKICMEQNGLRKDSSPVYPLGSIALLVQ